ncbi:MAG TPA: VWA domain-containing protein [Gemmatimonadales bacterium]|nr:VWA domain-containing protein [Gemmatimonadales bacterium]
MKSDVQLSTRFATTQNAHQVGMLITLAGDAPTRRAPINVALVLDRSGSMGGMPIIAARAAAERFASFLSGNDRLSVVAFDDIVETVFGPAPASDPSAVAAIQSLTTRGCTNLSGGWLQGMQHVSASMVDGTNRVVLLTDGQANRGITGIPQLVTMARSARGNRISTTCIGFGADYNEDLLEPMARDGGGNYWFVEAEDQMADIFVNEIEGLVALSAQNVSIEIRLTHPAAAGVTFLQSIPVLTTPDGAWRVTLGDLYATSPRSLGIRFHVNDVAQLGKVEVARVRIEADVVTDEGITHRTTIMPVMANLDGSDHVEPVVEETFLRFEAARAREEAITLADQGDYDRASTVLREQIVACSVLADSAEMAAEIADLRQEAERLSQRQYSAMDRKYNAAMAMSAREGKEKYTRQLRQKRGL